MFKVRPSEFLQTKGYMISFRNTHNRPKKEKQEQKIYRCTHPCGFIQVGPTLKLVSFHSTKIVKEDPYSNILCLRERNWREKLPKRPVRQKRWRRLENSERQGFRSFGGGGYGCKKRPRYHGGEMRTEVGSVGFEEMQSEVQSRERRGIRFVQEESTKLFCTWSAAGPSTNG